MCAMKALEVHLFVKKEKKMKMYCKDCKLFQWKHNYKTYCDGRLFTGTFTKVFNFKWWIESEKVKMR